MLNYEIYPNKQTDSWIVFVHGIGGNTLTWKKQIADFSEKYNLLLLDLPGHGKSEPINGKITVQYINEKIKEVLDFLEIKQADFVAMSLGTLVVLNFAVKYPKMIKSLILGGAIINVEGIYKFATKTARVIKGWLPKTVTYHMFARIIMPAKWHKKSRQIYFREMKRVSRRDFLAWMSYTTNLSEQEKLIKKLKKTKINICFISGDKDKCFINGIKHLSEKLEKSKFSVIEKCGHVCTIEKSKEFNSRALAYLKEKNK